MISEMQIHIPNIQIVIHNLTKLGTHDNQCLLFIENIKVVWNISNRLDDPSTISHNEGQQCLFDMHLGSVLAQMLVMVNDTQSTAFRQDGGSKLISRCILRTTSANIGVTSLIDMVDLSIHGS